MIDLKRVRTVALDIAGAGQSYEQQDETSEFIWHLLSRHYRMFLFTSNRDEDLAGEDFVHPQLTILREEMPPTQAVLKEYPALLDPETLWITDDDELQRWLVNGGQGFMYRRHDGKRKAGGQPLERLSELGSLLDPTALLLRDVTAMVEDLRRFRPEGALLVGIGGPPLSGYQQFSLDLRTALQEAGQSLVDLLDLSSLMRPMEELVDDPATQERIWVNDDAEQWLREAVLEPLRAGQDVYVEKPPAVLPRDFSAHFPLFVSKAAVLLVFAERVFMPTVADRLDLALLLEVSPEETTRRLYEIPMGEKYDPKFSAQYMTREGAIYKAYLERNRVREKASLRVDANEKGAFVLDERALRPLV